MKYNEFRPDGWPLCPQCGEDELYSRVMITWTGKGERPTMEECIAGEMTCYRCNWNSWRAQFKPTIATVQDSAGWPTEL